VSYGANAVTLITGPTTAGKSSLLATLAEWLWAKKKKITRLYTADGGGYPTRMNSLIQLGIVQVWKPRTRAEGGEGLVEETLMRASQGWWPRIWDPSTGNTVTDVELVPPVELTYKLLCPQKHVVKTVKQRSALSQQGTCETCKITVSLGNGTVEIGAVQSPGFEEVGAMCWEGVTSMGSWMMSSLADRTVGGTAGGGEGSIGRVKSGSMVFGSNNRAHYGFAQQHIEKWLLNSTAIPNLLIPPHWTGLEGMIGENSALPFWGPDIPGSAKSGQVPQWVENYLGAQMVADDKGKLRRRLYLSEYRGDDGFPHYYKNRGEAGTMPSFLEDAPGDAPFSGFNLGMFYDLLEKAEQGTRKAITEKYPEVPGLAKMPEPRAPIVPALVTAKEVEGGVPKVVGLPKAR
jgi:hypothetical protein